MIFGGMYGAILFAGINNGNTVVPSVAFERTVFYRERAAGMYSTLPYALAQVIKSFFSYNYLLTVNYIQFNCLNRTDRQLEKPFSACKI